MMKPALLAFVPVAAAVAIAGCGGSGTGSGYAAAPRANHPPRQRRRSANGSEVHNG